MSFSPSFFFFFSFCSVPFEPNIHLYKTQQQQKKPNPFWIHLSNKKELMPVFSKAQIIYKQKLLYPL